MAIYFLEPVKGTDGANAGLSFSGGCGHACLHNLHPEDRIEMPPKPYAKVKVKVARTIKLPSDKP